MANLIAIRGDEGNTKLFEDDRFQAKWIEISLSNLKVNDKIRFG